ncbi:hypothetical protein GGI26_006099 [Coemansia sp. RSA 1358]|uniref:BZIP domain-containing protein n=1 Tax=Coemansia umbellata TaxID=1424467 RepID=A0ABQ8PEU6_9FUNG|nr:hypothetical protein EDC05_005983 [Coemansia umbellata]KAJ2619096.1 hypothetical protein GGI26_006099 [Coemansia sp. RSA 1358]
MADNKKICGKPTLKQTSCKRLVIEGRDCCSSHLPENERIERKANRIRTRSSARTTVKTLKNENEILKEKNRILEIKFGALMEAFTGMRINNNASNEITAKTE